MASRGEYRDSTRKVLDGGEETNGTTVFGRGKETVRHFVAGILGGACVAGVFSPWDRALYLSVKNKRPFFEPSCWRNPYQGFLNGMFQRTLSAGMYFPLYDFYFSPMLLSFRQRGLNCNFVPIFSGTLAGVTSGVLLNSFCVVKYGNWGSNMSALETTKQLYRQGGVGAFFNATGTTAMRDAIFGTCYAGLRAFLVPEMNPSRRDSMFASVVAGAVGTIVSSPLNYARNMKYAAGTSGLPAPSISLIFSELLSDTMKQKGRYLSYLQGRLRVGWGTARVGIGMAAGFELYEFLKAELPL
jgi:hypothetical protein